MTTQRGNVAFWIGMTVFLAAVLAMTQIVRNEYPFFAGYVILQFIVLSTAWSILGGSPCKSSLQPPSARCSAPRSDC
jgi:branched-chain amino acid transport system permease protein